MTKPINFIEELAKQRLSINALYALIENLEDRVRYLERKTADKGINY